MRPIVASHTLTGELLTWALPVGLLVVIVVYWAVLLHRRSPGTRSGKSK